MKDSKTAAEKKKATASDTGKAKGAEEKVTSAKDAKKVNTAKKKDVE
ncbi:hypothetical protein EV200_106293 [Pedobacter psychrotolerans]|uniref:Uncharacterized protein n=1 Tax=Pedobacter psychrotolerans TaxID=1843235 RepID=A0A4R2HA23_9SPHI|nr:hypothetical protein [Pedobacter psychrotolerans]TCO22650.1 hypothetical protein EV200_106293 [Pedobacter psychrotolerans]GGE66112.1 hypothetical protein GCM10011413_35840 [Pedobacter psychrotolerans]